MTNKEMREWIEENCTYLVLYNIEGDMVDYFLNSKGINDLYKKRHEEIVDAEASNVIMTFREAEMNALTGSIFSSAVDKTSLVIYSPLEMVEEHSEIFMDDLE